MLGIGVDIGAQSTKVVILENGDKQILGRANFPTGFEPEADVWQTITSLLNEGGKTGKDIYRIVSTGAGRKLITFVADNMPEITADAKGVFHVIPTARTIIDIGAEEARAIRLNTMGNVEDFALNEKCAAGSGAFIEAMARALELTVPGFIQLSLKSTESAPMNAQCVIFAESEVVSLIHSNVPRENIGWAIHEAIGERISGLARRVGVEETVVLTGCVAKNAALVKALKKALGVELSILPQPEYTGALGAALAAFE